MELDAGMNRVRYLQTSASCDALVLLVSDTRSRTQSRTKLGESLTRRAQIPRKPEEIRIRHRNETGRSATGRIVFLLPFLLCFWRPERCQSVLWESRTARHTVQCSRATALRRTESFPTLGHAGRAMETNPRPRI